MADHRPKEQHKRVYFLGRTSRCPHRDAGELGHSSDETAEVDDFSLACKGMIFQILNRAHSIVDRLTESSIEVE